MSMSLSSKNVFSVNRGRRAVMLSEDPGELELIAVSVSDGDLLDGQIGDPQIQLRGGKGPAGDILTYGHPHLLPEVPAGGERHRVLRRRTEPQRHQRRRPALAARVSRPGYPTIEKLK